MRISARLCASQSARPISARTLSRTTSSSSPAPRNPSQDKAIAVHEKNLELMRRGLNNAWTQKSLDRLAALKPDTYARTEISSGFLGSLERYVYQPPPRAVEAAAGSPTAPATAQSATAPEGAAAPATAPRRRTSRVGQRFTAGADNADPH